MQDMAIGAAPRPHAAPVAGGAARAPDTAAPVRMQARAAGALWLGVVATGLFAVLAQTGVVVRGDAAATAARLEASETLFRLGFASNLLAGALYLGVTVLLYALLRPAGPGVSRLAASLGVAGVAAGTAASLLGLAPLLLLGGEPYLAAIPPGQAEALALALLGLQGQGAGGGMAFFGFQCVLLGWLAARSGFLPRALGVLLAVGGASYVVSSFAAFVAPAFGAALSPFILPAALVGEGSLAVWLVWKGVDVPRWMERARAASAFHP
ncbi:MAG TPA: DUF4386 domain-containing protein [Longimicrobium sp.]|nr:DUF4386 domain-containing protein [Longimicrobium sp.]